MPFTSEDLAHCDNLIRALKKGKYELDGMEIIAMSDVFKWVSRLRTTIETEINTPQEPKPDITAVLKARRERKEKGLV